MRRYFRATEPASSFTNDRACPVARERRGLPGIDGSARTFQSSQSYTLLCKNHVYETNANIISKVRNAFSMPVPVMVAA
ncbi:MAG: hypothetical protein UU46_C0035G0004 [Candidatus Uhrbacteria bacterium GW2011_GWD1_41_16]|nr:MAG: hypothetical protein UU46_C0035G0004 [Candidatus Uhrbacteria bacterium GW2011_GWD1_41_16]